eukprot:TRINITY_DN6280_c0_g1_i1.p2 TRINITY_DN6280_c0_g1~~TRINITY_DN6280_c0_g1_i1.p2  ORF type:complete len:77 (-),score=3.19 TRINITY_DN6280_c0_g1_i1:168-398(-)
MGAYNAACETATEKAECKSLSGRWKRSKCIQAKTVGKIKCSRVVDTGMCRALGCSLQLTHEDKVLCVGRPRHLLEE